MLLILVRLLFASDASVLGMLLLVMLLLLPMVMLVVSIPGLLSRPLLAAPAPGAAPTPAQLRPKRDVNKQTNNLEHTVLRFN